MGQQNTPSLNFLVPIKDLVEVVFMMQHESFLFYLELKEIKSITHLVS